MPNDKIIYEINLQIVAGATGVYIFSKDVPGLHLCGESFRDMKGAVEKAITRLFRDNKGIDVSVVWLAEVAQLPKRKSKAAPATLPRRLAVYPQQIAA